MDNLNYLFKTVCKGCNLVSQCCNSYIVFHVGRWRHNTESVVHENAYSSESHHYFVPPSNK
ncbi:hypothetical protein HanXRQr2_Chr07g0293321 [Helianthus annuus]|uniref:Uncharacterized protein n=1 Tax=Helianthus annuus TaxID=4232 RepID=A0A251T495_HELAN|nr:hypothetical protein HanXRQr2_Chr07g0293321 [Helianthus annuus]KAJ0550059.1 hypothetical protein HanHA300_Chr07g0241111 [Helianthus annuus]KAJ0556660.1 hypothetical protein HanIR_Chr07g0316361 [Helianthus annuus]KAJ0563014.1 hypothetical protein HanHA89_Chr07g0258291 [Helianthus annuus]KAJ0904591.1 hypothetical protein HanPSC8_Chr07g0284021 [Helianthus annuus]